MNGKSTENQRKVSVYILYLRYLQDRQKTRVLGG